MKALLERLGAGEVLVGDGALGTLLIARGLRPGEPPEALNLTHPEWLEDIARQYLEAGADLVTTNSFGGSPARLRHFGLEERTEAVNRAAVEWVRRAVGDRACVSASVGPSGQVLRPYGDADPAEIGAGFERQIRALAGAGADLVCIETMTDLAEALLAVRAAHAAAPGLPVMATLTFERTRRGFFTVMGASIEQAAAELERAGADILGSNCGNGSRVMVEIAREFRARTRRPVAIQPNAGLPETRGASVTYPEDPEFMAASARELLAAGVAIVGGCCGTTPAHVRAVRQVVDGAARGAGREGA
ncbi:MAG TPA: homocysteine S-methyltransferase family protein [Candidatus Saccharimonadales bacterium]|nr:homocysteine S-methyltransferase family protein [Candidatus Saccharimonadales bacterium]